MYQIEYEDRPTHKKKLFSYSGFTGMSLFYSYRNPLYGFYVLTDFVFDVFHTVPLNVVKNVLEALTSSEYFDLIKFDQLLSEFPWPPELKDGRIPGMIRKDRKGLSNWTGEQYLKFAFPLMEYILDDFLHDSNMFEMTTILARIAEINFYCGRDGWSLDLKAHQNLSVKLNVMCEEVFSLEFCTISPHNLTNIHEDVLNFGATDNFWRETFERAVKKYISMPTNKKGLEKTYAHSEERRELLNTKAIKENASDALGQIDLEKPNCFY